MKKINHSSFLIGLFAILSLLTFYGCEKNPIDNFKINVTPALFEYTAFIRIIDAADSTVPANLKIVLDPESEGYLYDILGKNKLEISEDGHISVGLKPSIKPDAANPVVIRFQVQANNYISENFSLVYHLGQFSVNKTYTLMNRSNLPRGVAFTPFSTAITIGVIEKALTISLGGTVGNSLKSASVEPVNKITIKAGTKFYYWEWDKSLKKSVKKEVSGSGTVEGQAYFSEYYSGPTCYNSVQGGSIDDHGVISAIPNNAIMANAGGWDFSFTLDGVYVYPEFEGDFASTLDLGLPKSGLNMKTGKLYQKGDVINIYHVNWKGDRLSGSRVYELLSSEILSENTAVDPNYFKLKSIHVNDLNNIMIGELYPIVKYDKGPLVKLQGDNTPPDYSNPVLMVTQDLYKEFKFNGYSFRYFFGSWGCSVNTPDFWKSETNILVPGTYSKEIRYYGTSPGKNSDYAVWNYINDVRDVVVGQGLANPFDYIVPSTEIQRTTLNFSVKCGTTIIKPSFYYSVGGMVFPEYEFSYFDGGFVSKGLGSSYLLKVGGKYKFAVYYEGKLYEQDMTISSSTVDFVIEDDRLCNF